MDQLQFNMILKRFEDIELKVDSVIALCLRLDAASRVTNKNLNIPGNAKALKAALASAYTEACAEFESSDRDYKEYLARYKKSKRKHLKNN